jgi:uncharacterized protein YdhG (YjbR/CyaY superfamily)
MPVRAAKADPEAVSAYIAALPEPARNRLVRLRAIIRAIAPAASERIAYGIPTWHLRGNLLHLGAHRHHIGIYPGPEAIEGLLDAIAPPKTSKGTILLPHDAPLPVRLIERLIRWRLKRAHGVDSGADLERPP